MSLLESKIFLLLDGAVTRLSASIWRACLAGRQGWEAHLQIEFADRAWSARSHGPQAACAQGNICLNTEIAGDFRIQTLKKCDYDQSIKSKTICRTLAVNHNRAMSQWRVIINTLRLRLLLMIDSSVSRLSASIWRGWKAQLLIESAVRAWSARSHGPQAACAPGIVSFAWWKSLAISTMQTLNKCDYNLSMKSKTICRTLVVNYNRAMSQWRLMINTLRLRLLLITDGAVTRLSASIWRGKNVHLQIKSAVRARLWKTGPLAARFPGTDWFECPDRVGAIQTPIKCDYNLSMKSKTICRTLVMSLDRAMSQWRVIFKTLRLRLLLIIDGSVSRLSASIWRSKNAHLQIEFAVRAWNARSHGPQAARVPGTDWFECPDRVGAIQTPIKCDYNLSMKSKTICRTLVVNHNRAMSQWRLMINTLRLRLLQITDCAVTQSIETISHGKNVHHPIKFADSACQANKHANARSHGPLAACAPGIDSFEWWKSLAISTIQTFKKCDYDLSIKSKTIGRTLVTSLDRAMSQWHDMQVNQLDNKIQSFTTLKKIVWHT